MATPDSPRLLSVASWIALVGALGAALLAIAHTGVEIPLVSALGPSGGAVPPAAAAFTVVTVLFAAVGWGLRRRRAWAWTLGVAIGVLGVLSGIAQFRGVGSALGMLVAAALAALLLAPQSRAAVRG